MWAVVVLLEYDACKIQLRQDPFQAPGGLLAAYVCSDDGAWRMHSRAFSSTCGPRSRLLSLVGDCRVLQLGAAVVRVCDLSGRVHPGVETAETAVCYAKSSLGVKGLSAKGFAALETSKRMDRG